jgi:4'-phosphopantetheinyl transferase EntD
VATDVAGAVVEIAAVLASIAPPGVRTGCRVIAPADVAGLHPAEADAISRAVPRRQAEFASGRALLRDLLGAAVTIPVGADRRPDPPAGVVLSLAHDPQVAVAAVADQRLVDALGIDVEPDTPLDDAMAAAILRPDEEGLDAHLAFSLKEAVYKAWSNTGGRLLDHHDVRILSADAGTGRFVAVEVAEAHRFAGRYAQAAGRWLALVAIPAPPNSRRSPDAHLTSLESGEEG